MTKSIKDLSPEEKKYVKGILALQGDVEYGFYNLYLEWQSKDYTSSEQRWRTARMVTDEVGHGLQIVRLVKQMGDLDLQKKLENKPFGSNDISIFNQKLETWDDVVMVATVLSQIDSLNLTAMSNCSVTELAELAKTFLLQETLHLDFGLNSIEEILKGDSNLGSKEMLKKSFQRYINSFDDLFAFGKQNPGDNESLDYHFGDIDSQRKEFLEKLKIQLERFDLNISYQ